MSFSKSKRFSYSEMSSRANSDNLKSPNDSRISKNSSARQSKKLSIHPKYINDTVESSKSKNSCEKRRNSVKGKIEKEIEKKDNKENIATKNNLHHEKSETIQDPLCRFMVSTNEKVKGRNPLKKIANGIKRSLITNVFTNNEYNVRKEEQKQLKHFGDSFKLNSPYTYEHFETELANIKKEQKGLKTITSDEKEDNFSETDNDDVFKSIEELILHTNLKMKIMFQESLLNIKEDSDKRIKCVLAEQNTNTEFALEKIQRKCEETTNDMNMKIKDILKKNSENLVKREKGLVNSNVALSLKLKEIKTIVTGLEGKYMGLLDAAEKKINHQQILIEMLKTEIDAMEMTHTMGQILRDHKKK